MHIVTQFGPNFQVQSVCGGDLACTFDYKATLNAAVGQDSLDVQKWDQQRREMGQTGSYCRYWRLIYNWINLHTLYNYMYIACRQYAHTSIYIIKSSSDINIHTCIFTCELDSRFCSNGLIYWQGIFHVDSRHTLVYTYMYSNWLGYKYSHKYFHIWTWIEMLFITVTTCGWLAVPYSTKAQPISYLAGSMVTITGCISGYTLEGPTQYTCEDIGDGVGVWSPDVTTLCRGQFMWNRRNYCQHYITNDALNCFKVFLFNIAIKMQNKYTGK